MTDGLQYTQRAVDLFRSVHGNKSTKGLCQKFDGYYWQWAWQGNENGIQIYASAKLAADASAMFTTSINDPAIQPGDLLYWHYVDGNGNNYGHVCTVVGRDGARVLVSNTATTGDAYKALTNDVKISHADTINLKFRGASRTNGKNVRRTGVAAWPAASLGPQQRQVRPDVQAKRRVGAPNTQAPLGEPWLMAGEVGNFQGWTYGETVEGNNLWYVGVSGDFFWSGSFTEVSTHDLKDMNPPAIGPTQRQVRADGTARQRREPKTSSEMVSEIAASAIATFDGWIHGEAVSGNDVWIREASSNLWSWSGGFTDTGTHDLADLNSVTPPDPDPATRTVAASNAVNVRTTPYTSAVAATQLPAGSTVKVAGWTAGERVSGQGIWYKVDQGWAWSGGFTSQSTDGLTELPAPNPPSGGINTDFKSFTPDSALAAWIGSPNFNWRTPRPAGAAPTHVTMHWMDGTLAGTDAQFQKYENVSADGRGDGSASNYGVGQSAIHQYVRERDYQQADGDQNSNRWGLSIEHEGSTSSPVTQAVMNLSARLLAEIAKRYGWTEFVPYTDDPAAFRALPDATQLSYVTGFAAQNPTRRLVFPHKAWVATSCPGTLDWQTVIRLANALLASSPNPDPEGIVVTREFVTAQVAAAEAQAALWKSLLT